MDSSKTPLAIFTYNRPHHTREMLSALENCYQLHDCRVVIYCDGPKLSIHEASVAATRQVVKAWAGQHNAEVIERDINLGLAHSIVSGVTEQCERYGRTIVVEDDLIVSPDFLEFMLRGLAQYHNSEKVYQISGFMFPIEHPVEPDAFFLPLTTTWGWATWDRAWRIFSWDAQKALDQLADPEVRRQFDLDGSFPYSTMLRQRAEAINDSWGILWWYAVFHVKGLVLHPRVSLVWNGGFDSTGVHSGAPSSTMQSHRSRVNHPQLGRPLVLPKDIMVDEDAFIRLKKYFRSRKRGRDRMRGLFLKLMNKLPMTNKLVRRVESR